MAWSRERSLPAPSERAVSRAVASRSMAALMVAAPSTRSDSGQMSRVPPARSIRVGARETTSAIPFGLAAVPLGRFGLLRDGRLMLRQDPFRLQGGVGRNRKPDLSETVDGERIYRVSDVGNDTARDSVALQQAADQLRLRITPGSPYHFGIHDVSPGADPRPRREDPSG